jgi:RNA polymerase sigma factor (sigma-70 family)
LQVELALKSTAMTALRGEQALVQAARRGDDRAFEQLYAQYRERITLFIHSKVGDHGRAEDISQEVFMAALRRLRSTDQQIAFKAWIFTIAKNACIDEFRRSARGREVGVKADDDFPTDQRASLSIVPSPPAAIESKQRLHDLRAAFRGLSQSHHRLLVMRELEGRSYDEIGNRLGMTRQGVESGLFRARRKLSEEYDELASGRRCEQVQTVVDSGAAFKPRQLGIKERRRLTLHLSECQACRQHARLAGIDETLLRPRSIAGKIAALVPFGGLWGWPWRRGGSASAKAHASGHLAASGAAQAAGTAGASVTLGQAAATVAALAIAGAGGGIAIADHTHLGHGAPPAHHVTTSGAGGAGTGAGATSAARSTAGSVAGSVGARSSSHSFAAQSSATGSKPGPAAVGTGTKHSGTNSSASGGQPTTGGSGSARPSASAPSTTPSSGGPAKNLLNTTTKTPSQTLGKVTAPVKKVLSSPPVTSVTSPVTAPVNKVLSSLPVTSVTNPVTAPVKKVVSSPPVTSVTAPISTATNPVTSAPPVKNVGSTVGGAVNKVVPPTSTTPSSGAGGSTGSSSSESPITTAKKVLGGP